MTDVRPFSIEIPDRELEDLRQRLALTRLPEKETPSDWSQGVPLAYMREIVDYWQSDYDWRRGEAGINRFPQFITELDGLDVHFVHVKSPESNALPLVMTHGWPGSIVEFLKVIGPLADPPPVTAATRRTPFTWSARRCPATDFQASPTSPDGGWRR